jgi:hypothetical protein
MKWLSNEVVSKLRKRSAPSFRCPRVTSVQPYFGATLHHRRNFKTPGLEIAQTINHLPKKEGEFGW